MKNFSIEEVMNYLPKDLKKIKGKTTLDLFLSGKISLPVYSGNLRIESFEIENFKLDRVISNFLYKNNKFEISRMYFEKNKRSIALSGYIPVDYKNKKIKINKNKDFALKILSPGFTLESLSGLAPSYLTNLNGDIIADINIKGSYENPDITGKLMIDKVICSLFKTDWKIENGRIIVLFDKNRIKIEKLSGNYNDNYIDLSGELGLFEEKRFISLTRLRGRIKNISFINNVSNATLDFSKGKPVRFENLSLVLNDGGKINLSGIISEEKKLDIKMNILDVNVKPLSKTFDLPQVLAGVFSAGISVEGTVDQPIIKGEFGLKGGLTKDIKYEKIAGNINLSKNLLNINSLTLKGEDEFLLLSGTLPLEKREGSISVSKNKESHLLIKAKNLNLYFLPVFIKKIGKCSSNINFELKIDGTLPDTIINGDVDMKYLSLVLKKPDIMEKKEDVDKIEAENRDMFSIENLKGEWKNNHIMLRRARLQYNNNYSLVVSGEGIWQKKEILFNFLKIDGRYQKYNFVNLTSLSGSIDSQKISIKESKFSFAEGEIAAQARFWWNGNKYIVKISMDKLDLRSLAYIADFKNDISGKVSAEGILKRANDKKKKMDINFSVKDFKYKTLEMGDIVGKISALDDNRILIDPLFIRGKTISRIEGVLPLKSAGEKEEMSLKVKFENIDMQILEIFSKDISQFKGTFSTDIILNGTLSAPLMAGNITIENGEFFLPAMKKKFYNINTALKLDRNKILFENVKASIGNGVLELNGEVALEKRTVEKLDFKVDIHDWLFLGLPDLKAKVDGNMHVNGNFDKIKITGIFTSQDAQYTREFEEISPVDSLIHKKIEESSTAVEYDLEIILPKNAKVKNKDVQAEVKGQLFYRESAKGTFFTGRLTVIRGDYKFLSKKFNIITEPEYNSYLDFISDESRVTPKFHFLGKYSDNYKGERKTIELRVEGTIDKPEIKPSSTDPGMKESDIFPFLMAGRIPSQENTIEKSMPKTEYQGLGLGIWGDRLLFQNLERQVEEDIGLDVFQVKTGVSQKGEYEFQAVKLSKYLAPNLYVTYIQPTVTTETKKFEAEYQINKFFSVFTEMDDKGTRNVDLKFKVRY
ncbi:translocation/assembly module TamB domain-containing protein [Candidatus Desantisbacteria bacterium]|nr:translocation/assembly module TamB domain-containing protein [Candidatus Desantisbacteria bacterium]